ncbi:rho guanine nucleotide exchange factor TIAM2-like [Xenentodon cancila]
MGNTDSHSSFSSPIKPSCALRFSAKREEVVSPHSWWRTNKERSYQSQHAAGLPYTSWHYEDAPRTPRGGSRQSPGSPPRFSRGERSAVKSGGSPKVLLSKDGSMRVEFTNTRVVPMETQGASPCTTAGPEPSFRTSKGSSLSSDGSWYDSPWGTGGELTDNVFVCGQSVDTSSGYNTYSSTHTEQTVTFPSTQGEDISPGFSSTLFPVAETATGCNTCSSGRTEDSGIGDSVILPDFRELGLFSPPSIYRSPGTLAAFPTVPETLLQERPRTGSPSPVPDDVIQEEAGSLGGVVQQYSCSTLPCSKPEPVTATSTGNNRKDFLKSRIRRLSDWTGSLSRKKRRIQEPHGSETADVFVNSLNSGLAGCNSVWSSNPLYPLNQNQFPPVHSGSSKSLNQNQFTPIHCGSSKSLNQNQSSDTQRQNIYENFMQELETGCSTTEQTETSEGDGEEEEEDEGDEEMGQHMDGGGGGQMDVLVEKEQGVVRRAGWLSFKALITVNKDGKLELVTRRKWRRYWVTLKGCTLLFYETFGRSGSEQELSPRCALLADDGIVQAVPEHPRREHVFCVSNAYGDVYLFQATNQTDLENWVTAIHSASAALLAKRQGKETLRLLRCQSRSLLHKIDMDGKMKKMAELQLSVIKEPKSRKAVESQVSQWEQNLEKLNLDLFRFRCYLSSLQGSELPNPKSLLAVASRPSKSMLGRLGVFSVSSFHALVCSREEVTLRRRCRSLSGGSGKRRGLPSSLKAFNGQNRRRRGGELSDPQLYKGFVTAASAHRGAAACRSKLCDVQQPSAVSVFSLDVCRPDADHDFGFAVTGHVDRAGQSQVFVSELDPLGLSAREGLQAGDEVLAVNGVTISGLDLDLLQSLFRHQSLQLLLRRDESHGPEEPGSVWPSVSGHADPCCRPPAAPDRHTWCTALMKPILFISGLLLVTPPDVNDVLTTLSEDAESPEQWDSAVHVCEPLRRLPGALTDSEVTPDPVGASAPSLIMGGLCWVLPLEEEEEEGGVGLVELAVGLLDEAACCVGCQQPPDGLLLLNMERVCSLHQTFPESRAADADVPKNPYCREAGVQLASPAHLSACQRLRKVIQELVDTEKSYVKDLVCLFDIYLTPLQNETFLSKDEMEALFGSLPEMLDFQRVFLQTLEERIAACPNISSLETPEQFKKLLFSLGGSFLYYADHFKLYSGFCANHIKVQNVLERAKTDGAFKHFLEARNPTNQHSSSLESFLIKPVQRVLKYPLLLRELVSLTDVESPEHAHLTEALRAMERVASHINEMQKIYEDYGCVFDQLASEQGGADRQVTEISMGEFLVHSSVVWLNPLPSLRRLRKEPELTLFVFKRAVILVYREHNKLKKRMTGSRSADLDPFRFRWFIPVSAVQVRAASATGSADPCVWELVHSRSEVEGRPETVFQLCSSGPETKASVLGALRSLVRDRASGGSARKSRMSTAEGSSSWRTRQQRVCSEPQRTPPRHPEENRRPDGVLAETCSEPLLRSHSGAPPGRRTRLCSLTNELEAQLQRLNFTEEERDATPQGEEEEKRRSPRGEPLDFSSLLERDFSVHSMASLINEDCFYDPALGLQRSNLPALQGRGRRASSDTKKHTDLHLRRTSTSSGPPPPPDLHVLWTSTSAGPPPSLDLHVLWTSTFAGPPRPLELHLRRTSTSSGSPPALDLHLRWTSTFAGPPTPPDLHLRRTSTSSGPPPSPDLHLRRTSTSSGPPPSPDLHVLWTSTSAGPPHPLDLHLCRTSTSSGPPPSPDLHLRRTSTSSGPPPPPDLHILWTSTSAGPPRSPDLQLRRTSTSSGPPPLPGLHLRRTSTSSGPPPSPDLHVLWTSTSADLHLRC